LSENKINTLSKSLIDRTDQFFGCNKNTGN